MHKIYWKSCLEYGNGGKSSFLESDDQTYNHMLEQFVPFRKSKLGLLQMVWMTCFGYQFNTMD